MPTISPEAPPIPYPSTIEPPCPGCPDPDNAGRIDSPCEGPGIIEDPQSNIFETPGLIRSIGAPVCGDIVYCPRTKGYTTK